jgi:DNA polymerase III subunit beta
MTKPHGETCVAATDLRRALKFVSQAVERTRTIPILKCVLLESDGAGIRLTATNLDVECYMAVKAEPGAPFRCAVTALTLGRILDGATGVIRITKGNDGALTFVMGDATATLRLVLPAKDWPPFRTTFGDAQQMDAGALCRALHVCLPRVSLEPFRYYISGVYLHDAGTGTLCAAATNGCELARFITGEPWNHPNLILPNQAAGIIAKAAKAEERVTIRTGHMAVEVEGCDWRVRAKTIDGTFPDYRKVIPDAAFNIDVALSAAAVRRLKPINFATCIFINPNGGTITMPSPDDGLQIDLPITGAGPLFGLQWQYLMNVARDFDVFRLTGKGPNDPVTVITDDPNVTLIIMPMRVDP